MKKTVQFSEILERFEKLFERARGGSLHEPTAMTLATASAEGRPSTRTVLLKKFDEDGFSFFTNRESRKGSQLNDNPWSSLCFYWDFLQQQANVEGPVEQLSDEESDEYWSTRPRTSQLGAWASLQSRPLDSRAVLLARVAKYEALYLGRAVPRPDYWGGYRLRPVRIEFWVSKPYRLHERTLYLLEDDQWTAQRLYP